MAETFEITFGAPNADKIAADVARFAGELTDFRPVWPRVFRILEDIAEDVFANEGPPGAGGRWKELSNTPFVTLAGFARFRDIGYRDWKETRYKGPQGAHYPKIMSLTGALHESLTSSSSPDAVRIEKKHSFVYGTTAGIGSSGPGFSGGSGVGYPMLHQTGQAAGGHRRATIDPPGGEGGIPDPWNAIPREIQRHAVAVSRRRLASSFETKADADEYRRAQWEDWPGGRG